MEQSSSTTKSQILLVRSSLLRRARSPRLYETTPLLTSVHETERFNLGRSMPNKLDRLEAAIFRAFALTDRRAAE
ncbi:MAG: hypothetical protein K2X93_16820 [Candidatus Obscuribacterales bacterium]|nr:hypothetical protein [Candidatus Obscuribacterales bacterium]